MIVDPARKNFRAQTTGLAEEVLPSLFKVFLQTLVKKIWTQYSGAHYDSTLKNCVL